MKRFYLGTSILLAVMSFTAFAAATNNNSVSSKQPASNTIQPASIQISRQQMELQLQGQELLLEQQLLQIRQQLFHLRQQDALREMNVQPSLDLHWLNATNGKVPTDAIIGAYANDKPLYICHADYMGGSHPGQVVEKGCLITYGGQAMVQSAYQVLTGKQKINWKPSTALYRSIIPMPYNPIYFQTSRNILFQSMPVSGGFENDRPLYICRAMFENQIHLGKVVSGACNIGANNVELRVQTYEVLFN